MTYFTRADWGAAAPSGPTIPVDISRRDYVLIHWPAMDLPADSHAAVRAVQRYHQKTNGWVDIGYNELVDGDGNTYEGRGLFVIGAHCAGWNTRALGICVMEDTPAARRAVVERIAFYQALAGRKLKVGGHRDGQATQCPGEDLYAWVRAGLPLPDEQEDDMPYSPDDLSNIVWDRPQSHRDVNQPPIVILVDLLKQVGDLSAAVARLEARADRPPCNRCDP